MPPAPLFQTEPAPAGLSILCLEGTSVNHLNDAVVGDRPPDEGAGLRHGGVILDLDAKTSQRRVTSCAFSATLTHFPNAYLPAPKVTVIRLLRS